MRILQMSRIARRFAIQVGTTSVGNIHCRADWLRTQDCTLLRNAWIFGQNPWAVAESEFQDPQISDINGVQPRKQRIPH